MVKFATNFFKSFPGILLWLLISGRKPVLDDQARLFIGGRFQVWAGWHSAHGYFPLLNPTPHYLAIQPCEPSGARGTAV
jgi:hypothetical protein